MKLRIACFIGAVLMAVSSMASADIKIGFVDLQRIMRESAPAVRASKRLEKEFEGRRQELQKVAAQGKALQQALDKNSMPEADRRARERELVRLNQDFLRMQRELNEDQNARRNEELAGLQERINNAIQQIANTEKYDLILQEAAWNTPKIDITDKVLKALADK
ncbi:outer membrane protein chaperone [Chitiniphilus shinanonensis]|uniref:Outer membrane protein chaperone n=1 Tax=Chitiniphilus shinanonensis TaxID=553088 RepID=A0ABQ6BR73_9NEIS|nr:OmpH family outer membrane protein [Chitiniphilus shinanonensis]GLS04123.1 outer membrane protein chaperone [Chitiniphilus shinanonensis]